MAWSYEGILHDANVRGIISIGTETLKNTSPIHKFCSVLNLPALHSMAGSITALHGSQFKSPSRAVPDDDVVCHALHQICSDYNLFTALHEMQTRSCDEISVCPSVRPSVRLSVCLSVCLSNACIVTK